MHFRSDLYSPVFLTKISSSNIVERISIKNVSAGYDINSIRNKKSKIHDKFIEVKGRKYDENSFAFIYRLKKFYFLSFYLINF